ncbi:hypothetical protein Ciccas_010636, partial [Cichlidogyrus casuarinus]
MPPEPQTETQARIFLPCVSSCPSISLSSLTTSYPSTVAEWLDKQPDLAQTIEICTSEQKEPCLRFPVDKCGVAQKLHQLFATLHKFATKDEETLIAKTLDVLTVELSTADLLSTSFDCSFDQVSITLDSTSQRLKLSSSNLSQLSNAVYDLASKTH